MENIFCPFTVFFFSSQVPFGINDGFLICTNQRVCFFYLHKSDDVLKISPHSARLATLTAMPPIIPSSNMLIRSATWRKMDADHQVGPFFSVRHPRLPACAMRNCRIIDAWCCADQIFKVHSGGLGRQSALKWNGRSPASRMCQVRKQKGWRKGRPAVICQSVGGRRVVQTSTGNQAEAGGDSQGVLASLLPCSLLSLCATLFPLHQMTAPIFLLFYFLSGSQASPNRHFPSDMFSCTSLYLLVWPTQSQTPQGAVSGPV